MLRNIATSRMALMGVRPLLYTPARNFNMVETSQEEVVRQRKERPTSPHLTIYKFPIPAIMSITHRATGIALSAYFATAGIGMLGASHELVYYISSLQSVGVLLPFFKFAVAFPLTYHTCAGARHLMWDAAPHKHLTLDKVHTTGLYVTGVSTVLALILAFVSF